MALFAIICTDRPREGLKLRKQISPGHVNWLKGLGGTVKMAGPFVDEKGDPSGSLIVIEAGSLEEAEDIASGDPYAQGGVFSSVEIRPFKWLLGRGEAD